MWTDKDLSAPIVTKTLNGQTLAVEFIGNAYRVTYFACGPVLVTEERALQILNAYSTKGDANVNHA